MCFALGLCGGTLVLMLGAFETLYEYGIMNDVWLYLAVYLSMRHQCRRVWGIVVWGSRRFDPDPWCRVQLGCSRVGLSSCEHWEWE